jgi:predicted nucleic acid-binding protein
MTSPVRLLDTSILLHLVRDRALGRYLEAAFQLHNLIPEPRVCVVSEGEIWALAAERNWGPAKRQKLHDLLAKMLILNINHPAVISAYVEIHMACRAHPAGARNMGQNDMWIAAVAKFTGATLLTTDKDFDHLHPTHLQRIYIDPASPLPPVGTP